MTSLPIARPLTISRLFTSSQAHPYDTVEWEHRSAVIADLATMAEAFRQDDTEFPVTWSQNATNIVAQKYFRVCNGEKEYSLRQVIDRIADTITIWGQEEGYFKDDTQALIFSDELKYLMLHQYAAFNSPVWFNIGVPGAKQQCSACYILDVDDTMEAILDWYREEGVIFKGGSGSGINLSKLRSSKEHLSGGGRPSGPVSFMRGADASAGTIKSGGTTRRAAKMVLLNADHPDIEEFINCKVTEERKAHVLRDAGYDMGIDGKDIYSVQYQNANNSVRVTDEFMQAVIDDENWHLRATKSGEILKTVKARDLMNQIAQAAWECADPGLQYDSIINRWHTSPARGRINGSNPCSEYVSNDNTSCNLASLNLMKFLDEDERFMTNQFIHAVNIIFTAQDILICRGDSPTEKIAEGTKAHRQIGLGYTNLGALLMTLGMPYDSDAGRTLAAAITSLMTGAAYATSVELAGRLGPYPAYTEGNNSEATISVLNMHAAQSMQLAGRTNGDQTGQIAHAAHKQWRQVMKDASILGVRNSQATLLAPTGTISFALDCDTTGIEPDFSLVKHKVLVGGGTMQIVNQSVPRALKNLGYDPDFISTAIEQIAKSGSISGTWVRPEHLDVFACAVGEPTIEPMGHVKMVAAVQPFLSGAVSKTVNVPNSATAQDFYDIYVEAWRLGVKCLSVYRDGCKVYQPLSTTPGDAPKELITEAPVPIPKRRKMPRRCASTTTRFKVADAKGYMTVGLFDDGNPGEVFIKVAKQGSTLAGFLDAYAIQFSHSLQYGEPLGVIIKAHLNHRFEPNGITDDSDVRTCTSIIDYCVRRLALDYLSPQDRADLGVFTTAEKSSGFIEIDTSPLNELVVTANDPAGYQPVKSFREKAGSVCNNCGGQLIRAGNCFVCENCGSTTGCS